MDTLTAGTTGVRTAPPMPLPLIATVQPGGWVLVRDRWPTPEARARLALSYLREDEQQKYRTLRSRTRTSWLLGRVAAKDAVRHWLAGWDIHMAPDEFAVVNDDEGRPHLLGLEDVAADLRLSIAHLAGCAVAMVGYAADVGIDIEAVEDRPTSFSRVAFTATERAGRHLAGVDDRTWMTAAWCAKEAVTKARGTGLQGRPSRIETRVAGPGLLAAEDRVIRWIQLDSATAVSADGRSLIVGWTVIPHDLIDLKEPA